MEDLFNIEILLTGTIIFFVRIVDVSIGTLRLLSVISGRSCLAFFLGFIEVSLWLALISKVLGEMSNKPLLGIFFALGFSAGNVVGILLNNKIALGYIAFKVFSRNEWKNIAEKARQAGFPVTMFRGEGEFGPITELYIVCSKKMTKKIIQIVNSLDPNAFYITEPALGVSKKLPEYLNPLMKMENYQKSESFVKVNHI